MCKTLQKAAWTAPQLKRIDVRNAEMPGSGIIVENANPGRS